MEFNRYLMIADNSPATVKAFNLEEALCYFYLHFGLEGRMPTRLFKKLINNENDITMINLFKKETGFDINFLGIVSHAFVLSDDIYEIQLKANDGIHEIIRSKPNE